MATWSLYWSLTVAILTSLLYLLSGVVSGGQAVASAILLWSLGTIVFLLARTLARAVVRLVRGGRRQLGGLRSAFHDFGEILRGKTWNEWKEIGEFLSFPLFLVLLTGSGIWFVWVLSERIAPGLLNPAPFITAHDWLQEWQAWRTVESAATPR